MSLAALAAAMALALSAQPVTVHLRAERLLHEGAAKRTTAEGSARLSTDGAALNAERIVYDDLRRVATAAGSVRLRVVRGGLLSVTADLLTVRFDDEGVSEVYLQDGVALSRTGVTPEALLAADTAEALAKAGRPTARLDGNHLKREGHLWVAESVSLVPCDCDFEKPSWRFKAGKATVDLEAERVSLLWATVYVGKVPVLWLPWLSMPMSSRQTGLLQPRPNFTALNGFSVEQPVFVTLGRSADVTVTPGYFFGGEGPYGVKGPRLLSELRYTPAAGVSGRLSLGLLYDLRAPRDPASAGLTGAGERGLRGELSASHRQALGGGFALLADVNAHSDGDYQRDVVTDVIAREPGYLRSTVALLHRGLDHQLSLDAVVRQDLSAGYDALGRAPFLSPALATPRFGPGTLQRLPAATLSLPTRPVWGPLSAAFSADVVRLAPLFSGTGDEGAAANAGRLESAAGEALSIPCLRQRLFWASPVDPACVLPSEKAGQGDRLWQPGEREARTRLNAVARLDVAGVAGAAALSAFAFVRPGLWVGEQSGSASARLYPVLGARAETALQRDFLEGGLRHELRPSLEVRSVPVVWGTTPAPWDEVDVAMPDTRPRHQGVAQLAQRLWQRGPGGPVERLTFRVGQGAEVADGTPRLLESFGEVSAVLGPVRLGGLARVDPVDARLTRVAAQCAVELGAGRGGQAAYDFLLDDGTNRSRGPIDLLAGAPVPAMARTRAQLLTAGLRWRLGDVGLRYDAMLFDRLWPSATGAPVSAFSLAQHGVTVSWTPPCDCWRMEVWAIQRPSATGVFGWPDLGASFAISNFGSFATSP